jgi:hypothetical protein
MLRLFPVLSLASLRSTEPKLQCSALRVLYVLLACAPARAGHHANKSLELALRCLLCAPDGSEHRKELVQFALPVVKVLADVQPATTRSFFDGCRDEPLLQGVLADLNA